jgi:hypothetical protein
MSPYGSTFRDVGPRERFRPVFNEVGCVGGARLASEFDATFPPSGLAQYGTLAWGLVDTARDQADRLVRRCLGKQSTGGLDLHEPWMRSRGGSPQDPRNILPLCRFCHEWVTAYAGLAEQLRTRHGMPYVMSQGTFRSIWPDVPPVWTIDLLRCDRILIPAGPATVNEYWRVVVGRACLAAGLPVDTLSHATLA